MSKDKKSKKDKKGKKAKKGNGSVLTKAPKQAVSSLEALSKNPLVADVVAAALVSMAAALKDSDKARRLAQDAGDELSALSKKTTKDGSAMWDLALDIGRRTIETLAGDEASRTSPGRSK
ncbi:MAG: hypothetical protein ACJ8EH_10980 [Sphingomicrobium sp.]